MSYSSLIRSALACVAAIASPMSQTLAEPVRVQELNIQVQGGTVRGFAAFIDLAHPAVEVVVTEAPVEGGEALLTPTNQWFDAVGVDLAVNANFFGIISGRNADIIGLSKSDGDLVSPVRAFGGRADPSIGFTTDSASVDYHSPTDALRFQDAVAGVGMSSTDSLEGTLLVDDGQSLGSQARVVPGSRNPRTAAGVSQNGQTLILVTVDGRQPSWSVGMTLPELADLMIDLGAWDAVNLDGGGSTSFIYEGPDGQRVTNRPSDGQFRSVANHLGIRIDDQLMGAPAPRRPVRGVWLRPPSTIAAYESIVSTLADAGIRDIFLETFYWGLATNDSSVFQPRFTYDYLREAIDVSAKYGVKVHAWLETGYWGFQSTADYILNDNPEWMVTDINGVPRQGDIAQQTFVNLGHPEVQAMLGAYVEELAAIPGLEGIHIDYHRFPIDRDTSDAFPAPYSYDLYSTLQFQALGFGPPQITARFPGDPDWNAWVSYHRAAIGQAVNVMNQSRLAVEPGSMFSGAIFASAISSSTQLSKMQDWPSWAANDYLQNIVPMAYGPSSFAIRTDIRLALNNASGQRVIAGLALTGTSPHPDVATQLGAIAAEDVFDFVFFEANHFISNPSERTALTFWINNTAPVQPGDFDRNGDIDARDIDLFDDFYPGGEPVRTNGFTRPFDLNDDGFIDETDREVLLLTFRIARFGQDGVVNQRDLDALLLSFTGPGDGTPPSAILHLYDLDGDNDVDDDDRLFFHTLLTEPLECLADVSGDGAVNGLDFGAWLGAFNAGAATADQNTDGQINGLDFGAWLANFNAGCD